jgi:membrane-bound metal-dependent hydrolase YbcI (DUF457 family)
MTGKGHTWVGLATAIAAYKFSQDLGFSGYLATFAYIIGATAPDWLEVRYKSGEGTATLIKHRTVTHWILLWILGLWFTLSIILNNAILGYNINANEYVLEFFLGFFLGGMLHLITDLPNPQGIPVITPFAKHRFSLNMWKSGKNEVFITVIGLLWALWYTEIIFFNPEAVENMFNFQYLSSD